MWMWGLFLPKSYWLWYKMIKCLHDELKWGGWCRHCDAALGYLWPSDDVSEEGSSALDDPRSLMTSMAGCQNQMISVVGDYRWDRAGWQILLRTTHNLTFMKLSVLWIFHFTFFDHGWLQATKTMESKTVGKGRQLAVHHILLRSPGFEPCVSSLLPAIWSWPAHSLSKPQAFPSIICRNNDANYVTRLQWGWPNSA